MKFAIKKFSLSIVIFYLKFLETRLFLPTSILADAIKRKFGV